MSLHIITFNSKTTRGLIRYNQSSRRYNLNVDDYFCESFKRVKMSLIFAK